MTMNIRPIIIGLLLAAALWGLGAAAAFAQSGDGFRELLCRMAVGNVVGARQPMLELYRDREGVTKSGGAYGLFTGFYIGDRGWSGHGPTLDDPAQSRFLKDGTPFTNQDAGHLRSITAEFRQGACDELPTPTS